MSSVLTPSQELQKAQAAFRGLPMATQLLTRPVIAPVLDTLAAIIEKLEGIENGNT